MFTHPDELDRHERQDQRKAGIFTPPLTYSWKQILEILLLLVAIVCGLLFFR